MIRKPTFETVLKSVYASILVVASGVLFVFFINDVFRFIRVRSGIASWVALMSLIVLGIGEVIFAFLSADVIRRRRGRVAAGVTFLRLSAALAWLTALLKVFGVWTYMPKVQTWLSYVRNVWDTGDHVVFAGGVVLGVGGLIAAAVLRRHEVRNRPES